MQERDDHDEQAEMGQPAEEPDTTSEEPAAVSADDTTSEGPAAVSADDTTSEEPVTVSTADTTSEEPATVSTDDTTSEEPATVSADDTTSEEPVTVSGDDTASEEPVTVSTDDTTSEEPATVSADDTTSEERATVSTADTTSEEPAAVSADDTTSEEPAAVSADDTTSEEPAAVSADDTTSEPATVSADDAAPEAGDDGEPPEEEPALPPQELRAIVEALIFASPQPVTPRQIGQVLAASSKKEWQAAIDELRALYASDGRGLQLVEIAGGWQITTRPEYNDWVRELLDPKTPTRLSIQALETLAVIAYKQPVTLPEVIELRGVKSGGVVKTLLEKRLIRIVGRKEVVGRPMLYGTTKDFLLHFGLKDLSELPKIEEFAEVLGEEVDVAGLKKAIESPTPVDVPLAEAEPAPVPPLLAQIEEDGAGAEEPDTDEAG